MANTYKYQILYLKERLQDYYKMRGELRKDDPYWKYLNDVRIPQFERRLKVCEKVYDSIVA